MLMTRTSLLALLASLSQGVLADEPPDPLTFIQATPCLEAYRGWLFDSSTRRPLSFSTPSGFTDAQCAAAIEANARVPALQDAAILRAARDQAASAAAAAQDQRQADAAADTAARKRETDAARRRSAQAAEQRAEQRAAQLALAKLPPPRIGMAYEEARRGTNWGLPNRASRLETADGTVDTLTFDRGTLQLRNGRVSAIYTSTY